MRSSTYLGDCREVMAGMDDCSVDAVVTDPPAGISFMNKTWDGARGGRDSWIAWFQDVLAECFRLLKPGGHAFVWAYPRTSHWTATAIEDAGFEIRDVIDHVFGTGFPKSLNLGDGVGTALKPAHEHWVLARRPVEGTVRSNRSRYGTGGLNIDWCRVGSDREEWGGAGRSPEKVYDGGWRHGVPRPTTGRWPPNLLLSHSPGCRCIGVRREEGYTINCWTDGAKPFGGDAGHPYEGERVSGGSVDVWECVDGCPVKELNRQSGERRTGDLTGQPRAENKNTFASAGTTLGNPRYHTGDHGGASRYFPCFRYESKPAPSERDAGCEGVAFRTGRRNHHPTVKSVALMRWLIRLVCPRGKVVLDPFTGSGTTGIAAHQEGCGFVGIEKDPEYFEIAVARIKHARQQMKLL